MYIENEDLSKDEGECESDINVEQNDFENFSTLSKIFWLKLFKDAYLHVTF